MKPTEQRFPEPELEPITPIEKQHNETSADSGQIQSEFEIKKITEEQEVAQIIKDKEKANAVRQELGIPTQEIKFSNPPKEDEQINNIISDLADSLIRQGEQVNPFVLDYFQDPDLFRSLPEEIKTDKQKLSELILNMGKFDDLVSQARQKSGDTSGLLGKKVHITGTLHADGRTRSAESGEKINVDFLRDQGIDPSKVLFFRITQPADRPKPEYYWTSDYYGTKKGLAGEITPEKRKTAIILTASLDVINNNGGLIQDINDDNGLAVRQIGNGNFDQNLALTKIKPSW